MAELAGRDAPLQHLTGPPPLPIDTQRLFSHENSSFQMFSSEAYGQKNLLFKDATSELVPIATQTYEAWLGPEYLRAMKGFLCDSKGKSTCLFSHWLQPGRAARMAGFSGEMIGVGGSGVGVPLQEGSPLFSLPCLQRSGEKASPKLGGLLFPEAPPLSGGGI